MSKRIVQFTFKIVILLATLLIATQSRPVSANICTNEVLKVAVVQGHVVSLWKGGEEPIPNAQVELKELRNDKWHTIMSAISDEKGFFKMEAVPSGMYEIDVTSPIFQGFGTKVRVKRSSNPHVTREIVVVLEPAGCGSVTVRKIMR